MLGLLLALLALVAASRFYPRLERLEVAGNRHHSAEAILRIAKLEPGDPFLWITKARLQGLLADPWIERVSVVKRWPHTVTLFVTEREPAVLLEGEAYALAGVRLEGASEAEKANLIAVSGWGEDRRDEAFAILALLADHEAKVLSYSPAGFAIQLAHTHLFTPNLDALEANWASFVSQEGARAYVYPWGVSAAHD